MGLEARHYSGMATRVTVDHVVRHGRPGAVEAMLQLAGESRSVEELRSESVWSTYSQFRSLLEAAATVMGGPDALAEIGRRSELSAAQDADHAELVHSLGSPAALYGILDSGHTMITTIVGVESEQVGETEWLVRARYEADFEAFEENCEFSRGMFGMIPRIFGYPNADVAEETCQRHGDRACTYRIRWHAVDDDAARADYFERRSLLLESRLTALNNTVADLISTEELDVVLTRIVASAAKAVHAPGFVLVIDAIEGSREHILVNGVSQAEAERVVSELRSNADVPGVLLAEVMSSRRRYGWLAAVDPDGIALPQERLSLESYARLAATALDSATALAASRAQEDRASALLALSTALAEIATLDEIAVNLADAIPAVAGCDGAVVAFIDDATGVASIKAVAGFGDDGDRLLSIEVPRTGERLPGLAYYDRTTADPTLSALMATTGVVSLARVPIVVEGAALGWVVAAVMDRPERLTPSPELEARLGGLAAQASTAVRNARLMEQIRHQAMHDSLTGLPNRLLIVDRTEAMLARARRGRSTAAALFIDLDGFKEVNDTLGHAVGDDLLCAVAVRLKATLRASDTVSRLGGDEFVVLSEGLLDDAGPANLANRILTVLREPFHLSGPETTPINVSASIGIAVGDRPTAEDLLHDADVALYRAKAAGRDCYQIFDAGTELRISTVTTPGA